MGGQVSAFVTAALRYAADGYPVLPCKKGTKLPLTKRGFHDASTDPGQIREWWDKHPDANIAVVPGEGHSVVVDVDGPEGRATLETLGLPNPGRIVVSPGKGGGYHYWYKLPAGHGVVNNGRPWPGIDIRGHNGYVMVPPSVHPETKTPYAYSKDDELTVLPATFLAATSADTGECRTLLEIRNVLRRVIRKSSKDADARLAFYIKDILATGEGKRHEEMVQATWDLATMVFAGELSHDQVMQYGEAYESACQPWDVKDDFESAMIGAYRKLPTPEDSRLYSQSAADSEPRKARWLWHEKIPLGSFSLIAGRQGIGKSTVVFDTIAKLSRGKLPGDLEGEPRGALIIATEDSWEEKILPSIIFSGADRPRIHVVKSRSEDWFTDVILPDDLEEIERMCADINAGIVIFDPITSRLARNIDTHKDSDVRRGLEPLAGFARKTGISVLGVIHVNKGGGDPLSSVMGSQAFTAAARSVLFAAQYDDDNYALSVIKSNSGPSNKGAVLYQIEPGMLPNDIPAVKVKWGEWKDETMDDITAKGKTQQTHEEAIDWLSTLLSTGPVTVTEVEAGAKAAGISVRGLKAARGILKVASKREGFQTPYYWSLP
jgi:hypothetical protein